MPKWTDYTIKTEPADKDEVMILDASGKANKRLGLSALSDWIIGKIANKVFENLQTQNKTILGALNELNSKGTIFVSEKNNDFEWAKNYWYTIQSDSCVKFVYNSSGAEFFYIFVKRINAHGLVLRCGYTAPQIEMIRFMNKECVNEKFDVIK